MVCHCLYSLYCLEEKFSETELPVCGVLGNSEAKENRRWPPDDPQSGGSKHDGAVQLALLLAQGIRCGVMVPG